MGRLGVQNRGSDKIISRTPKKKGGQPAQYYTVYIDLAVSQCAYCTGSRSVYLQLVRHQALSTYLPLGT